MTPNIEDTPCPACGEKTLVIDIRTRLRAKPSGGFSLAGNQMKFSANEEQDIWCVCGTCGVEGRGKRE